MANYVIHTIFCQNPRLHSVQVSDAGNAGKLETNFRKKVQKYWRLICIDLTDKYIINSQMSVPTVASSFF